MKNKKKNIERPMFPADEEGNELRYHGWDGVAELAALYGKSWQQVGELIEHTWGDRTTMKQIVFACAVYASLMNAKEGYYKAKRQKVPVNENDIHYAIRMDYNRIKKLFYEATSRKKGTVKDFYKSARQLYTEVMKKRGGWVKDATIRKSD
jgi:hypothetical protein